MNRVSPVAAARATAASRPSPRLSTVSLIPGIDTGAPERTDSSSGNGPAPKVLPERSSSAASCAAISASRPSGSAPSAR